MGSFGVDCSTVFPVITVSVTLTIVPSVLVIPAAVPISSAIPIPPIRAEAAGQHRRHKKNAHENQHGFSHLFTPFDLFCKRGRENALRLHPYNEAGDGIIQIRTIDIPQRMSTYRGKFKTMGWKKDG